MWLKNSSKHAFILRLTKESLFGDSNCLLEVYIMNKGSQTWSLLSHWYNSSWLHASTRTSSDGCFDVKTTSIHVCIKQAKSIPHDLQPCFAHTLFIFQENEQESQWVAMTSQLWWHKDWVRYKYSHQQFKSHTRTLLIVWMRTVEWCFKHKYCLINVLKSIKNTSCVQLVEMHSGHKTTLTNRFSNVGGHAWSSVRAVIDSCWLIDWLI